MLSISSLLSWAHCCEDSKQYANKADGCQAFYCCMKEGPTTLENLVFWWIMPILLTKLGSLKFLSPEDNISLNSLHECIRHESVLSSWIADYLVVHRRRQHVKVIILISVNFFDTLVRYFYQGVEFVKNIISLIQPKFYIARRDCRDFTFFGFLRI